MKTTMRDVIEIHEKIANMEPEEAFMNPDALMDGTDTIGEYMNEVSTKAQALILEKIKEEDFVKLTHALGATLVHGMLVQEGSTAPLRLLLSGEMDPFIQTMILSVIGSLVDEEVL